MLRTRFAAGPEFFCAGGKLKNSNRIRKKTPDRKGIYGKEVFFRNKRHKKRFSALKEKSPEIIARTSY